MDPKEIERLFERFKAGEVTLEEAVDALKGLPFRQLPFATVDHHRQLRRGFPEVILGQGKSGAQIAAIATEVARGGGNLLVTRVDSEKAQVVTAALEGAEHHPEARAIVLRQREVPDLGRGPVAVVCAGTSDIPVAKEAALTCELLGNDVELIVDVGVAGIHRLMGRYETLRAASVIVVVAGMEGALASVIGGIVARPIIAVPTSIGYGASFQGLAALLGMLNSCSAGVTVVNIDNGFGAGYAAALINRREPV